MHTDRQTDIHTAIILPSYARILMTNYENLHKPGSLTTSKTGIAQLLCGILLNQLPGPPSQSHDGEPFAALCAPARAGVDGAHGAWGMAG